MTPIFSVVIPAYNHAAFIREAVDSVLSQTMSDLELIIVDDGSTDDTQEVLASIHDPRLRVISQKNRGAHAAINQGLSEAQGNFRAILNSDDAYHPQRLELAANALTADPSIGIVGSYIEVIDTHGALLGIKEGYANLDPWPVLDPTKTFKTDDDLRLALLMQNYWSTTSNFVMRDEEWKRVGAFVPLRFTHDWDFALRSLANRPAKLIKQPLLRYRIHSTNTIRANRSGMIFEICWVLARHLPVYIKQPWFWNQPIERRVEQLFWSVHVYGCDRVLMTMLLEFMSLGEGAAMDLLDLDNAARQQYLAIIDTVLQEAQSNQSLPSRDPRSEFSRKDAVAGLAKRWFGSHRSSHRGAQ
jgi:glycosyltransferase involved in cell wall biosynthesis